jgi:signal peptidase II
MGIVGGGLGNLIDRIFRSEGVIDFIDVKWFGMAKSPIPFLRMERWPTFNVADSAVVICGILLIISFIVLTIQDEKESKNGHVGA